jgi:hypothetical protein
VNAARQSPVPTPRWFALVVTAAFVLLVGFGAWHHEMWMDEVRAWSIATDPSGLTHLPANLRNEGHPALWYILLKLGALVSGGSPLALPVVSALVAAVAVWIVARYAPLPLWQRALFAFGVFPAYHYSVMARNYGISMLLLFAYCALGPARLAKPIAAGVLLALLANTNAHSLVLTSALLLVWLIDTFRSEDVDRRRTAIGMSIAVAGCLVCVVQLLPDSTSVAGIGAHLSRGTRALAVARGLVYPGPHFADAFVQMALPAWLSAHTRDLLSGLAAVAVFVLVGAILFDTLSLFVAHVVAVAGLTALFTGVYAGGPRHEGLEYLFVIALLWLWSERTEHAAWRRRAAHALIGTLFVLHCFGTRKAYDRDVRNEVAAGAPFSRWIHANPAFENAIIVAEPDFFLESIPYYLPNRTYVVREHKFARWTHSTTANQPTLTLGELLDQSHRLQAENGTPVLILFAYADSLVKDSATVRILFGRRLTWQREDRDRFLVETRPVAKFNAVRGFERYAVYALAPIVKPE